MEEVDFNISFDKHSCFQLTFELLLDDPLEEELYLKEDNVGSYIILVRTEKISLNMEYVKYVLLQNLFWKNLLHMFLLILYFRNVSLLRISEIRQYIEYAL